MTPQVIIALISVSILGMAHFGMIVWFASSLRTSVQFQATAIDKLTDAVKAMHDAVTVVDRRVTVLETLVERTGT